jgi:hypothetical protein
MTSLPERTAKKTLVASIVALHGNGCKQASYCWLFNYSVHVTIYIPAIYSLEENIPAAINGRNPAFLHVTVKRAQRPAGFRTSVDLSSARHFADSYHDFLLDYVTLSSTLLNSDSI